MKNGFVCHCLRYTRTLEWVTVGYSDEIIGRATRQKSLKVFQRYVHLDVSSIMRFFSDQKSQTGQQQDKIAAKA